MVPSSVITVAVDGEYLSCGRLSLGKAVCLRNFEFIADYFGDLSPYRRRGDTCTAFMGSTRSEASIPQ
jgi:hypothetical protein